jgi:fructose-specific phosphotransferase system IIC component
MLTIIQTVNVLAFAFMAYVLAGVLAQSLKDSELLKPIAMTICSITIAFHLHQTGAWMYIVGAFVGYFAHTCVSGYTKKVKAPAANKRKKVVNINP